ncbi:hypothetical protein HID58_008204 [Brassica napus]|uniref:Uncharacterized protein n=1 Tax=Brassica napus TaxID=3708 RepID=A0ABQ8DPS1_BRANA|nr:hypothetical protein HID58_008204 [Brassica napus]
MKTQEGIKKYCSILSSSVKLLRGTLFSTGIASSAGKFALSLPSTNSSTLPSSNPSLTVSLSTITSSSAYSTGLFPITTSSTKIPNPYTSHFSVILTVRHANFRAVYPNVLFTFPLKTHLSSAEANSLANPKSATLISKTYRYPKNDAESFTPNQANALVPMEMSFAEFSHLSPELLLRLDQTRVGQFLDCHRTPFLETRLVNHSDPTTTQFA